jgi:hypothetical protein
MFASYWWTSVRYAQKRNTSVNHQYLHFRRIQYAIYSFTVLLHPYILPNFIPDSPKLGAEILRQFSNSGLKVHNIYNFAHVTNSLLIECYLRMNVTSLL